MTSDHALEELLRAHLRHDARRISLPERQPERAAARARTRRHRRFGLVGCAIVAAGAVAVVPALRGSGDPGGGVETEGGMLAPTGPLALDWQRYDGGVGEVRATFQDEQGVIYALSTAPGTGSGDPDDTPALYRLGDDGAWQPVVLGEGEPQAVDVSGTDGLLYAVSTSPGDNGESVPQLSSSADSGETWSVEDLPTVAPPSEAIEWEQYQTLAVESNGPTTLALVTTTFSPVVPDELFPEMAAGDPTLAVESRAEGLTLVRVDVTETAAGEAGVVVQAGPGDAEVVRVVPWSDLGVESHEALTPPSQIFRSADGWEPLESEGHYVDLTVAAGCFVLVGSYTGSGPSAIVRASQDGSAWSDVELPAPGRVVSVNNVLVDVPDDFQGVLHASADGGRSWQSVDLAAAGIDPDHDIGDVAGGPLGLALVTATPDSSVQHLTVTGDLVDWTTTSLPEVTGVDGYALMSVFVGADRIVVRATPPGDGDESTPPPDSVTAVATPARTP